VLRLSQDVYAQIRLEAEGAYPCEGCGVLLGVASEDSARVTEAVAARTASASPLNHYERGLKELVSIQRQAQIAGLEIVGFYHSHPDHPAEWSKTDFAEAHWIGCSYVITEVAEGRAGATNSFWLAGTGEVDKRFDQQEIYIEGPVEADLER